MHIIEPCCVQRQLLSLRNAIGKNGTREFEGYGDLSLTELLPALLTRYGETEMMIVAPSLPDQAAEVIDKCMRRQRSRIDGKGKLDVISRLTVVASMGRRRCPVAASWRRDNPFAGRLKLVSRQVAETAILLPDFAITGPVNMRYGSRFTATATADPEHVRALWEKYLALAEKGDAEDGRDTDMEDAAPLSAEPSGEPAVQAGEHLKGDGGKPEEAEAGVKAAAGKDPVEADGTVAASED